MKFQAVAEKTAKDARGLLYFAAPGIRDPKGTIFILRYADLGHKTLRTKRNYYYTVTHQRV